MGIKNFIRNTKKVYDTILLEDKQRGWLVSHIDSLSDLLDEITEDSLCIDCGANMGVVSDLFLRFGAEVHAFEPNKQLCHYIRYQLSDFVSKGRLHIHNEAVLDREDKLKLYMRKGYGSDNFLRHRSGQSSLKVENTDESIRMHNDKNNYVLVDCIDLSDFIRKLEKDVHILKMDIEGAEFEVLKKLIETDVYKRVKHIYVEAHDRHPALKPFGDEIRQMIKDRDIKNINLDWH